MAKSLSILYVSSELFPYAKINPLADVAFSLPLAVREIGHDIRVMLPKYGTVSERKNRIHEINRLKDMAISIGGETELATVKSSSISNPRTKVQAYITTNVSYLDNNKGIYFDFKTGKKFADNDERFIFFNKTVIETCLLLGWFPDIIHVNDWQTAMIPAFARVLFPSKFKKTKIALTIHNFQDQGVFPESTFDKTGLPSEVKANFIHNGQFNFLKGAIHYADSINTVSPTYAQEILQDSGYSMGLNQFLIDKNAKFTGINDGIDYWTWHPKHNNEIASKYTGVYPEYKRLNRADLMTALELEDDPDVPLIAVMSNFDEQSGMKLLAESMDKILKEKVRFIVMGDGDLEIRTLFKKLAKKYPKKITLCLGFDEIISHKLISGADFMLLPSKYEPSAMSALFGLAHGTIPIARTTGANIDIIKNYSTENQEGNGFLFDQYNADALLSSIKNAIKVFENKAFWYELGQRVIAADAYYWEESAKKYDEIYRALMKD